MAQLVFDSSEIEQMAGEFHLPFRLRYCEGKLQIQGDLPVPWNQCYVIEMAYSTLKRGRMIFRITRSTPSFWIFDDFVKTRLFQWFDDQLDQGVELDYPLVILTPGALPGLAGLMQQVEITGLEFDYDRVVVTWRFLEIPEIPSRRENQDPGKTTDG